MFNQRANKSEATTKIESAKEDIGSRFRARFGTNKPITAPNEPKKATTSQVKNAMKIEVLENKIPDIHVNPPVEIIEPLVESDLDKGLKNAIAKKRKIKEKKIISDGRAYCSQGSVPYSLLRKKAYGIYKETTRGNGSLGLYTKIMAKIWNKIPLDEKSEAHNNIDKYVTPEILSQVCNEICDSCVTDESKDKLLKLAGVSELLN